MTKFRSAFALYMLLSFILAACAQGAAPAGADGEPQVRDIISWYPYDQNNEDPVSDERVGNEYLRRTIPLFNEEFAGQWNWINEPKAWDRMQMELIAAVQAAGEIPDVMQVGSTEMHAHLQNGSFQDIREWAEAQPWFSELDDNALAICIGPDNGIYCIPIAQTPQLVFVWKDRFPNGFPATPEEFLEQAEALKEDGLYAITFFGSTDFEGAGATRFIWMLISSFGGAYDDGQGNMTLNTPENIAAIEFLREIVARGYVPEIAFAGNFQEEEAFKDASAAAFPTGIFGYRYVNPLTAPNGTVYGKGSEEDMLDAIAAGDVYLSPFLSVAGEQPGCGIGVTGLGIPTGAANPDGAKAYINWVMSAEQNPAWVLAPGGGFPTLASTQEDELFQTPFFRDAAEVVAQSACSPWYGTLERRPEAQKLIMTTIYRLIKETPTADIAAALIATETEYNANN